MKKTKAIGQEEYAAVDNKEAENALKAFLLDIECLDPLSKWTSKRNLFDILKISRTEIRHSNMLAWLLNPSENHGLGDSVLCGFIQYYVTNYRAVDNVFSTLLLDCYSFTIMREWHNIDIIAVSSKEKAVLCIENKIGSGEHDNQLDKYRKTIDEQYPDYTKMYIFLSPDEDEPSDTYNWCPMGYQNVLNILDNSRNKTQLLPDVALLIDNYTEVIRRDIVKDTELAKICAEIYAKHQKALDLIFENKPDKASKLAEMFRDWASTKAEKGELIFVPEKSAKTITRFKTKTMSEILPDSADTLSGWGTSNYYFYEIVNVEGSSFWIKFVINSTNIPDELMNICDRIMKLSKVKKPKENWTWKTIYSTNKAKTNIDEELSETDVFEQLDKQFAAVKKFETQLKRVLSN